MQIEIRDDVANYMQSKALEAGFADIEAYLLHLVKEQQPGPVDPATMPYDQWREKFRAFVARQTSRNPHFDDSRESIYSGP